RLPASGVSPDRARAAARQGLDGPAGGEPPGARDPRADGGHQPSRGPLRHGYALAFPAALRGARAARGGGRRRASGAGRIPGDAEGMTTPTLAAGIHIGPDTEP